MSRYVIDRREGLHRDETPERIEAWLRSHGHPDATVISTGYGSNGNLRITVEAADDPTPTVNAYTPTPTPREVWQANALNDARTLILAIARKPHADRTPVERVLLGLALKVNEIDDGS